MTPLEMLRALGPGEPPSVEAKQRVHQALIGTLGTAAMGAAHPTSQSGQVATNGALGGLGASKAAAIGAGLWLLGGVTGAAVYGVLRPSDVRVIYVERPAASASVAAPSSEPASVASAPGSPALAPPVAATSPRRAPSVRASSPAELAASSELARERALLDVARASAARGEPARVLEQIDRHRRQFPHGRLTEEGQALAIRALLSLGRKEEAQKRVLEFRAAYPNSFLTPMLDAATATP